MLPMGIDLENLDAKSIQNVRALPAAPGTVLMWNQNVWHWSGHSSRRAQGPRVAMAFEMQTASVPPFQAPLIDPLSCPPPLNERLALVARQILQYRHFTKIEGPPLELAQALLEHA
jgi:ectoine hydroxylase-related dioxygenase (phytanoyl-CoA dioxygenase family)